MNRKITAGLLLILNIGVLEALDTESYYFIDHLLNISRPGEPEIYEDGVIFTASAANQKVGIAFAHEGFAKVYWFKRLLIPKDPGLLEAPSNKPRPVEYQETGILFHVYAPPEDLRELSYRLVIDGLWSADPLNPRRETTPSGIAYSVMALPPPRRIAPPSAIPGILSVSYQAPPGERITLAGSFNGWDPFMYELRETGPGFYALSLPLPPGAYQYVFIHRGERIPDPANQNRAYTREGKIVSEVIIR